MVERRNCVHLHQQYTINKQIKQQVENFRRKEKVVGGGGCVIIVCSCYLPYVVSFLSSGKTNKMKRNKEIGILL